MIPEGLEYRKHYKVSKDSLDDFIEEDFDEWHVIFTVNNIMLYGKGAYNITGDIGNFHVNALDDNERHDHVLWCLGPKFTELLNYHIVDYTVGEFVTVFNYIIESVEELLEIINDFKVKGIPSYTKRALQDTDSI